MTFNKAPQRLLIESAHGWSGSFGTQVFELIEDTPENWRNAAVHGVVKTHLLGEVFWLNWESQFVNPVRVVWNCSPAVKEKLLAMDDDGRCLPITWAKAADESVFADA
jgi:hypothetical protein